VRQTYIPFKYYVLIKKIRSYHRRERERDREREGDTDRKRKKGRRASEQ
jgi:hypothetical protein